MKKHDIIAYYNSFVPKLIFDKKINHARYKFIEHKIKHNISKNDTILDLGCGIGTTTNILSKYGKEVIGVDFAEKNIEKCVSKKNIKYICDDICTVSLNVKFDFLCLFDVLEHIKVAERIKLFKNIIKHSYKHSKIMILIPYWHYLDHKRKIGHKLQIIDNSIHIDEINSICRKLNLEIVKYEILSLFHNYDYSYIEIINVKNIKHEARGV
ncbi:class I SAM-dependent methyltransferase [Riemerella anatipestifer]|nr:class I SAM-dependent methyltransferase [Riemerella anatipestifer]